MRVNVEEDETNSPVEAAEVIFQEVCHPKISRLSSLPFPLPFSKFVPVKAYIIAILFVDGCWLLFLRFLPMNIMRDIGINHWICIS